VPVIPIDPAVRSAIRLLDELTEEEFAAVRMPVKPYGITREEYRQALADGSFDVAVFTENVRFSCRLLAVI
jgi:hypothetical protein